ncbi:MAG: hypothetical protein D3906_14930, partial [Candidatus Electrothrix sp. AUS1_2]|nr:hypothetical protein [Candidatus Electrothrix sp. AUS1_2]
MSSSLREKAFPVSLDSLNDMRDYVQKTAEGLPLSPKKVYKLKLAVDEIATNIVLYSAEERIMSSSLREKAFPVSLDSLNDMRDYVQKTAEGLPLSPKKV